MHSLHALITINLTCAVRLHQQSSTKIALYVQDYPLTELQIKQAGAVGFADPEKGDKEMLFTRAEAEKQDKAGKTHLLADFHAAIARIAALAAKFEAAPPAYKADSEKALAEEEDKFGNSNWKVSFDNTPLGVLGNNGVFGAVKSLFAKAGMAKKPVNMRQAVKRYLQMPEGKGIVVTPLEGMETPEDETSKAKEAKTPDTTVASPAASKQVEDKGSLPIAAMAVGGVLVVGAIGYAYQIAIGLPVYAAGGIGVGLLVTGAVMNSSKPGAQTKAPAAPTATPAKQPAKAAPTETSEQQ